MIDAGAVPADLQARRQWVTWRLEERDGKATKVPYRADESGQRASTTDPATWASFDEALDAADWLGFDGVGFVFHDDPFCGIDLDAGLPESDRAAIMLALSSYTETSVGGAGAHVIVRATLPPDARNRKGPLEVYDRGRYFVVTGQHVPGSPGTIEERQAQLDEVLAHFLPPPPAPPRPPQPVDLDDRDLLERAFAARNGADFQRLYQGDTSGFPSRSEADLAFCRAAAFWTGRDPVRIDAWLRSSGLMRDKWGRADYRERTIEAAIAGTSDVYTPTRTSPARIQPERDPAPSAAPVDDGAPWRSEPWPVFRDESPEQHRWIVDGLIPEGALGFIAGPPKKGKTWLGLGAVLAVATGRPLLEYSVADARDVLYVALEGSRTGLRARIGALARGLGTDPDSGDLDRLHMLYRPRPFNLAELATAAWLAEEAERVDAVLIVVDVLRAAARFQENVAEDFARVRDALEPLLDAARTALLLHHFGKLTETQKERSPGERMAGTGAMYGALDVGLLITSSSDGARTMRVDVEARDFAAPDALGVVILGEGSGEHGGFTYADTATLAIDERAAELIDYTALAEALLEDGTWRSGDELAAELETNRKTIETALVADAKRRKDHGEVVRVGRWDRDGRELPAKEDGKPWAWNARPWGTHEMFTKARSASQPSQPSLLGQLGSKGSVPSKEGDRATEPFESPVCGATEPTEPSPREA